MEILNKKQKIILIIILIIMLIFIGYYIITRVGKSGYINLETEDNEEFEETDENVEAEESTETEENIIVHVTGAIKKEGIVTVKEGSRISDVIKSAGGTTKEADLSKINLAYVVQDGQKIYVPSINDKEEVVNVTNDAGENVIKSNDGSSKEEKVNINTATQTELETLNGIGPSTALKIINYRNENGNFKKIEDIKNVPGIGDSKFEGIKENITVR